MPPKRYSFCGSWLLRPSCLSLQNEPVISHAEYENGLTQHKEPRKSLARIWQDQQDFLFHQNQFRQTTLRRVQTTTRQNLERLKKKNSSFLLLVLPRQNHLSSSRANTTIHLLRPYKHCNKRQQRASIAPQENIPILFLS